MDMGELRAQLEKGLGRSFGNTAWKMFRSYACVEDFLDEKLLWEDLLGEAEEFLDMWNHEVKEELRAELNLLELSGVDKVAELGSRVKNTRRDSREVSHKERPQLTLKESLRAEVFEECLAQIAARDPKVIEFRKSVLGGRLLKPGQALKLIRSPAAQALSLDSFKQLKIPVLSHDAKRIRDRKRYVDLEDPRRRSRAKLFVDPPGETITAWSPPESEQRMVTLDFVNSNGYADRCRVFNGSLLGDLHELGVHLAERFSWQRAQATRFVLTGGEPPAVPPVTIRYKVEEVEDFRHGQITLTVVPWMSATTVNKVYLDIQRRMLDSTRNRKLELKNLELLRFVMEREDVANLSRPRRRKKGQELVEEWNKMKPGWAYNKSQPTSTFWRDYDDIEESVVRPRYRDPRKVSSDRA
jgi:hypothetical protein